MAKTKGQSQDIQHDYSKFAIIVAVLFVILVFISIIFKPYEDFMLGDRTMDDENLRILNRLETQNLDRTEKEKILDSLKSNNESNSESGHEALLEGSAFNEVRGETTSDTEGVSPSQKSEEEKLDILNGLKSNN